MSAPRRKLASAVAGLVARRVGETTRCEPCVFSDRARAMHALARGVIARDRVEKSPFDRDAQQRRDVSAFKRFPFPKSHGAEGLPDQYLRQIKKVVPMSEVIDKYIPGSGKHTSRASPPGPSRAIVRVVVDPPPISFARTLTHVDRSLLPVAPQTRPRIPPCGTASSPRPGPSDT